MRAIREAPDAKPRARTRSCRAHATCENRIEALDERSSAVSIHHGMLGNLPCGTERTFTPLATPALGTAACSIHENILDAGAVVPRHRHPIEEVIVCLSGEGECTFEGQAPERYRAGSVVIIPPGVTHTLRNVGAERLHQLAFLAGREPGTQWLEAEGSVAKTRRSESAKWPTPG
jgi:quercetin dioxygenase-like cupin family protein